MAEFLSRLGRLFDLGQTRKAYRMALLSPAAGAFILPDLAEFCGANDPAPPAPDLFMQGRHAGRRDVWLHIQEFLHLTDEELMALYQGRAVVRRENIG